MVGGHDTTVCVIDVQNGVKICVSGLGVGVEAVGYQPFT